MYPIVWAEPRTPKACKNSVGYPQTSSRISWAPTPETKWWKSFFTDSPSQRSSWCWGCKDSVQEHPGHILFASAGLLHQWNLPHAVPRSTPRVLLIFCWQFTWTWKIMGGSDGLGIPHIRSELRLFVDRVRLVGLPAADSPAEIQQATLRWGHFRVGDGRPENYRFWQLQTLMMFGCMRGYVWILLSWYYWLLTIRNGWIPGGLHCEFGMVGDTIMYVYMLSLPTTYKQLYIPTYQLANIQTNKLTHE